MALKINATDVKRGDYFFVDPFEIIVREELRGRHFRPSDEDIVHLAMSLYDHEQLQPCQVRRIEDQKLLLTLGFTRCAAAREIRQGFTGVDGVHRHDPGFRLKVIVGDANDEDAFIRNVVENAQRNETTPIDDAHNQHRMRERYGYSDTQISRIYAYNSPNKVGQLRKLLSLDTSAQRLIHDGYLSVSAALELLELPEDKREEVLEECRTESGKVNGQQIRAKVRDESLNDDNREEPENAGAENDPEPPKVRARSVRELRKFFEKEAEESEQTAVRRFSEDMLKYIGGKSTDRQMQNAIIRILQAEEEDVVDDEYEADDAGEIDE